MAHNEVAISRPPKHSLFLSIRKDLHLIRALIHNQETLSLLLLKALKVGAGSQVVSQEVQVVRPGLYSSGPVGIYIIAMRFKGEIIINVAESP